MKLTLTIDIDPYNDELVFEQCTLNHWPFEMKLRGEIEYTLKRFIKDHLEREPDRLIVRIEQL